MSQTELDVRHGYAFSQEEAGAVSQTDYIRSYDTTLRPASSRTGLTASAISRAGLPPVSDGSSSLDWREAGNSPRAPRV